ncbi:MAG TPA: DUF3089 domain-containing protein [Capillimicrobium sp.]
MARSTRLALALAGATLALAVPASGAAADTTWLCKPGLADNPCEPGLDITAYTPDGEKRLGVERVARAKDPAVDCFYVYPTTSDQKTPQANLEITPELRSIALYQAARYSSLCRVYAPVYRQITIQGLLQPETVTEAMREQGYADVRAAWREYLRDDNDGRGVVLIGHSQGTRVLRDLVTAEIDPRPRARRRLVSALLLGGTVLVERGSDVGGDFQHVRACRLPAQVGCVIAFNTFNAPVPAESRFGRTAEPGLEVLCTNPGRLRGGSGLVTPIYPTEPFAPGVIGELTRAQGELPRARTPWISLDRAYRARCSSADGASVLQVRARDGAPVFPALPDANWGLHLQDANIALADLLDIVARQVASYTHAPEVDR